MSKMKKLVLSLLLATPMVASAAGMGVYVPVSLGDSGSYTYSPDYTSDVEVDRDYKTSAGLGLTFDTNIGKDKLFNYRLGLEYINLKVDNSDFTSSNTGYGRFNLVNTFGFGVLRTESVRLWIGPRINVGWNVDASDASYSELAFELGIAPAIGVNVNLGRVVSLAADIDYRFATVAGAWDSDTLLNSGSYTGSVTGATARFYVLFRFGEEFQKKAPQSADQGVIDQSL